MTSEIVIPYEPRSVFWPYHGRKSRWACIVAHRRAGKTVAVINDLIRKALTSTRPNPRVAYVAPYFKQAKDVAWQYLLDFTAPIPERKINASELRVDLPNGGRVRLYGADNPDSLRGIYLDEVCLDEFADMDPRVWSEVIRPALSDRSGGATFIGTPRGHNALYEIAERAKREQPDWYFSLLKASETGLVPGDELAAARQDMSVDEYEQEYECSFEAAVKGAFYAREIERARAERRIGAVAYDRYLPVMTAWDLGFTDATAIWFAQAAGQEIHLIDYYEASGVGLDHYAAEIAKRGYKYSKHYLPHDVQAHELGTGRSRVQTLRELGINPVVIPQHTVLDGINAVRRLFDRMWFDEEKCRRGIEALTLYRREWDEKGKVFRSKPLHDWTSHASDAMRCFAAGFKPEPVSSKYRSSGPQRHESWMTA
jgi:hypothetical protein